MYNPKNCSQDWYFIYYSLMPNKPFKTPTY